MVRKAAGELVEPTLREALEFALVPQNLIDGGTDPANRFRSDVMRVIDRSVVEQDSMKENEELVSILRAKGIIAINHTRRLSHCLFGERPWVDSLNAWYEELAHSPSRFVAWILTTFAPWAVATALGSPTTITGGCILWYSIQCLVGFVALCCPEKASRAFTS